MSMLLLRFPLDVKPNKDHTEGYVLLELLKHMTREETRAFVAQCGLMINSMDYQFEGMGDHEGNVALDVYDYTGMLPLEHVRNVVSYALQTDIHRQSAAFGFLANFAKKKPEVKAALQRAVRGVPEKTVVQVYKSYELLGEDMYECYLSPLLRMLDVAERRFTKPFLRRLARHMQDYKVWGGETSALEHFEAIARRSLNDQEYQQVRGVIVPEWDD